MPDEPTCNSSPFQVVNFYACTGSYPTEKLPNKYASFITVTNLTGTIIIVFSAVKIQIFKRKSNQVQVERF